MARAGSSTTAAFEVEESPRPPSELSAASETKAFGPGEEVRTIILHAHARASAGPPLIVLPAQLDPEVLSDLSYAFMAIDLDHSGTLEPNELLQLLRVLGNDDTIEVDECRQTIVDVKVSVLCLASLPHGTLACRDAKPRWCAERL